MWIPVVVLLLIAGWAVPRGCLAVDVVAYSYALTNAVSGSRYGETVVYGGGRVLVGAPNMGRTGTVYEEDKIRHTNTKRMWDYTDAEMGATMAVNAVNGRYVVCARRSRLMEKRVKKKPVKHYLSGSCFAGDVELNYLMKENDHFLNVSSNREWELHEFGYSAHVGPSDIWLGVPLADEYAGTLVKCVPRNDGSSGQKVLRKRDVSSTMYECGTWLDGPDTGHLTGLSVTTGQFFGDSQTSGSACVAVASRDDRHRSMVRVIVHKTDKTTKLLQTLTAQVDGQPVGQCEFINFGYAMVSGRFYQQILDDLVVAAPMYRRDAAHIESMEDGAVFVYSYNSDTYRLEQKTILVPHGYHGRFGFALAVGDLNGDSENDLIVGAPMEDDAGGRVYVFLGGGPRVGLSKDNVQIIERSEFAAQPAQFGFSLSNTFVHENVKALAIGAPGADKVFVYKSVPVLRLTVDYDFPPELKITNKTLTLGIKYAFAAERHTSHSRRSVVRFTLNATFRSSHRVAIRPSNSSDVSLVNPTHVTMALEATSATKTADVTLDVEFLTQFQRSNAIWLDVGWMADAGPANWTSNSFGLLASSNRSLLRSNFSTGCKDEICDVDLRVVQCSVQPTLPLIKGAPNKNVTVTATVANAAGAEPAYRPRLVAVPGPNFVVDIRADGINVTSFVNRTSRRTEQSIEVDLQTPVMQPGDSKSVLIPVDTSMLHALGADVHELRLNVSVSSEGKQRNDTAAVWCEVVVPLKSECSLNVKGTSSPSTISSKSNDRKVNINSNFKIKNIGHSSVDAFQIGVAVRLTANEVIFVDQSSITINPGASLVTLQKSLVTGTPAQPELQDPQPLENAKYITCDSPTHSECATEFFVSKEPLMRNEHVSVDVSVTLNMEGWLDYINQTDGSMFVFSPMLFLYRFNDTDPNETFKLTMSRPTFQTEKDKVVAAKVHNVTIGTVVGITFMTSGGLFLNSIGYFGRPLKAQMKKMPAKPKTKRMVPDAGTTVTSDTAVETTPV